MFFILLLGPIFGFLLIVFGKALINSIGRKRLGEAKTYIPVEEIADEFGDFIRAINGRLTKEDENFIKQLKKGNATKQLSDISSVNKKRQVMSSAQYALLIEEWKVENHSFEILFERIIQRWGSKYIFNEAQQVGILTAWKKMDDIPSMKARQKLREYFDEYHNNS